MTQTAQKSISLTLESMLAKFKESFPNLVAPFEAIKPDLERGEGAQALANLIGCEVEAQDEQGLNLYRWEGRSGMFEMRVPKPFDPNRQRSSEPQQQAQVQVQSEEPSTPQEAPREATEASDGPEAEGDIQLPPEESSPSAGAADKPESARENIPVAAGVFSALAELIGESTLLMTMCKHGDDLTVTVTPFGDDKESGVQSVAVTATAAELDEGFVQAIRVKTEGRKALAEQIEALKAAEKELVDAKKAETDAKTKEADKRKKAADSKKQEDEKKAKEAEEKKKAEEEAAKKAGEQASIF